MRGKIIGWLFCALAAFGATGSLFAQGTAFTYQGQLNDGNGPTAGNYDLKFALYNSTNLAANIVTGPVTNSAVAVTNGLFTVQLNFGPGIFTGTNYWLEIAVRTNGTASFSTLSPRQPLLPAPYAVFANTASNLLGSLPATQLSGALPSAQISGTYLGAVTFSNSANSFIGAFSGNGSSLSNLNASELASGTMADARLSANVALLNTNQTFTGSNIFTGFDTFKGTNTFTGVNTFTNFGNSFRGSFFGNGLVGWIPTNGTPVQTAVDTGYVLTNSQFMTVTPPASPNVRRHRARFRRGRGRLAGQGESGDSLSSATSPATATAIRCRCKVRFTPMTTVALPLRLTEPGCMPLAPVLLVFLFPPILAALGARLLAASLRFASPLPVRLMEESSMR